MQDLFEGYALGFAQLYASGGALRGDMAVPANLPVPAADAPVCMVFSPHPDDEAVSGALPYRLRLDGWRVINVAVSLGSNVARRAARWRELQHCCAFLGFDLVSATGEHEHGMERIAPQTQLTDAAHWGSCVEQVAALLRQHQPRVVVCPHDDDGHPVHIGSHLLVMDALRGMERGFSAHLAFSEYWNTQSRPGLMVELGTAEVGALMGALSQHVGEVSRNPYHLGLPAWFIDGVRRGTERVGAAGAAAPDFVFASLYGWQRWADGALQALPPVHWPLRQPLPGVQTSPDRR